MTAGSRGALVDGRPAHQSAIARVRRRAQRLAVSRAELDEVEVERRLIAHRGVTRANLVAVMSASGGVGKTTCSLALGNLLATHLKLRAIVVGSGTLAQLVPESRTIRELLDDAERLYTAAELSAYVSRLPTGLHVLAARQGERLALDDYGALLALLSCFYEAVVMDLGAGVVGPVATLAARRADQIVLVTTADRMTSSAMLHARAHLGRPDHTVVAINRTDKHACGDGRPYAAVTIPDAEQLSAMLETGTYSLGALDRTTRLAIKRLGLIVAERLV